MDSSYEAQTAEPDDGWFDDLALEEMLAFLRSEAVEGCLLCQIDEMDEE